MARTGSRHPARGDVHGRLIYPETGGQISVFYGDGFEGTPDTSVVLVIALPNRRREIVIEVDRIAARKLAAALTADDV